MIITREVLSLSNPSFHNIPDTTIEDTARRGQPNLARVRLLRARIAASAAAKKKRDEAARRRGFQSAANEQLVLAERARVRAAAEAARKERERKASVTNVVLSAARDETVLIPEISQIVGASPRALARARRRGQTRIVSRTAARRGRTQKKTTLRKTIIKVGGRSCKARLAQDVGSVTTAEAQCELAGQKVGEKSRRSATGRISLTRRQAGLLGKLSSTTRSGGSRRGGGRLRTTFSKGGFDIPNVIISQAKAFQGQESKISRNLVSVGVGGGRTRRTVKRQPRGAGQAFSIARSKSSFLLSGRGSSADFERFLRRERVGSRQPRGGAAPTGTRINASGQLVAAGGFQVGRRKSFLRLR